MPRSGRGGRRTGTPGKAYSNRTDLTAAKPLPTQTVPGQEYGQATAQKNAMRAVPMASGPLDAAGAGLPSPPAAGPPAAPPPVTGLPAGLPTPGSLPPLDAPTGRPDEHLMTGVAAGPGAGPEALAPMVVHPLVAAAGVLNALGDSSPQVKTLRDVLNAQLSNQATP